MTLGRFSGDRDNNRADHYADQHDDPRVVRERALFLEKTNEDLDDAHAEVLAWREAGYSRSGIAQMVGVTERTVVKRIERITVQYGIDAILSKQPEERGRTPLEPVTREAIEAFPPETRAEWRSLAADHPELAPEWFDPDPAGGDEQGGEGA